MFAKSSTAAVILVVFTAYLAQPCESQTLADAQALFRKFLADAQAVNLDANNKTQTAVANLEQFKKNVTDFVQKQLDNITEVILQNVLKAVQGNNGAIEKLADCANLQANDISTFKGSALVNLTNCVTNKIKSAVDLVADMVNETSAINTIILTAEQRLNQTCPPPANPLQSISYPVCIVSQTIKASAEIAVHAAKVGLDFASLSTLISSVTTTLPADVLACMGIQAGIALINSTPIIADIVLCTLKQ